MTAGTYNGEPLALRPCGAACTSCAVALRRSAPGELDRAHQILAAVRDGIAAGEPRQCSAELGELISLNGRTTPMPLRLLLESVAGAQDHPFVQMSADNLESNGQPIAGFVAWQC